MNEELKNAIAELEKSATTKAEETARLVADLQSKLDSKKGIEDADFKAFEEKINADMEANVKSITEASTALEEMKTNTKALEEAIARGISAGNEDKNEVKSSEDVVRAYNEMVEAGFVSKTSEELRTKAALEIVTAFMPHLNKEKAEFAAKTMVVGSNPDGGYFVPASTLSKIFARQYETSPMRQICNIEKIITDRLVFLKDNGEIGGGWVGEVDSRSETDGATIGEGEIPVHEYYAYPWVSQKLLEDSTRDISSMLTMKAIDKTTRAQNTAFVSGNAIKQPRGFLDYSISTAEYTANTLQNVATASSGTIVGDDLISLQTLLFDQYVANAKFVMSRQVWAYITKLKDSDGAYLINPRLLFEGVTLKLFGTEIKLMQDMPKTVVAGAKAVAYGDFKEGYTIVDRLGMKLTNDVVTTPGTVKLAYRSRVGGGVTNVQAIKLLTVKA